MRPQVFVSLFVLLSGTIAAPASAAVFLETSVEDVARTADVVVRGRVAARASFWTRDGAIMTELVVRVSEAWKGAPEAEVRLVVPGGTVGDLAQRVDAVPPFDDGEEVVVFLSRRGDHYLLTGLAMGKFRVEAGRAIPALGGIEVRARALASGEMAVSEMALGELKGRVAEVVR